MERADQVVCAGARGHLGTNGDDDVLAPLQSNDAQHALDVGMRADMRLDRSTQRRLGRVA